MATALLTSGRAGSIHTKTADEFIWDTNVKGLGVRIGKTGRRYVVRFRVRGQSARHLKPIGSIDDISLTQARALALDILVVAHKGRHPDQDTWDQKAAEIAAAEAMEAEAAAVAAAALEAETSSFLAIANEYLADTLDGGGGALDSKSELERKLKVDLKAWHETPIGTLTRKEIKALIKTKAQSHKVAANRLLSFVKCVFRWAVDNDKIEADPAAGIKKYGETKRKRFLNDQEIRIFWAACDRLGDPAGRIFKLCLLTGQRKGEVAGLRRSELGRLGYTPVDARDGPRKVVQGHAWLLPAGRTKRKVEHAVPLSSLAKSLIDGAPKLTTAGGKLFDHVLASGSAGDAAVSGWSSFKRQLDEQIGKLIAEEVGQEYEPEIHRFAEPWCIHDLRRTCATHLEMPPLSYPKPVIGRILNHAEYDGTGPTGTYLAYEWDREAAEALQAWAERVQRLVRRRTPLRRVA